MSTHAALRRTELELDDFFFSGADFRLKYVRVTKYADPVCWWAFRVRNSDFGSAYG